MNGSGNIYTQAQYTVAGHSNNSGSGIPQMGPTMQPLMFLPQGQGGAPFMMPMGPVAQPPFVMVPMASGNNSASGSSMMTSGSNTQLLGLSGSAPLMPFTVNPLPAPGMQQSGGGGGDPSSNVCKDFLAGKCTRPACRFIHLPPNIRPFPDDVCKDYIRGSCSRSVCRYFHGTYEQLQELRLQHAGSSAPLMMVPPTQTVTVAQTSPHASGSGAQMGVIGTNAPLLVNVARPH